MSFVLVRMLTRWLTGLGHVLCWQHMTSYALLGVTLKLLESPNSPNKKGQISYFCSSVCQVPSQGSKALGFEGPSGK